ncbi:MAG TPA: undecaprenyldiphospho-muramoylpentapeptide beta-N-acetylglucosaminyltransferase [Acidimicrobiales bacterium]|nr:undecaprenyldiphospho-muramoylpentapeptide beta-N-acetylglucosaminyltransferase [Acidimicrobiales bacterium]
MTPAWALVAGGGTAGHVLPGIAIGKALVAAGHDPSTIRFVGSTAGMEAALVPEAGFGVTLLPGKGIQRRLAIANLGAALGLAQASAQALRLVRRARPAVVVSLGGYASVPCAMAAAVLRVPIVVHEQNAVPGAANRLVGRFARACAVSFPGTDLPRAVLTGNPVRAEVLAVDRQRDRSQARARLGIGDGRRLLAIFGGSLGAGRINGAVRDALPMWADRSDLAVHHIVGRREWPAVGSSVPSLPAGGLEYEPVEYEARMDLVLAAADLVVCRAGATSIAELSALGAPSILVPLPGAPGDHQTANAQYLERAGGAVLLPDAQLNGAYLVNEVDRVMNDGDRLSAMGRAAAQCGRPDAATRVAALVEEHAKRG